MFADIAGLMSRFSSLGTIRAFCKPLAENDNSKQQIYLGGNLEAAQIFPFEQVETETTTKDAIYKAKLDFAWVDETHIECAPHAQLILYPQYPEVRLSGFLRGCRHAPNEHLRPIPKERRRFNNGPDGRILFIGITTDGRTLAYLATADSLLAQEFRHRNATGEFPQDGVFFDLPLFGRDSRSLLLEKLASIRDLGWQPSIRMNKHGAVIPYEARNGGGYTLEALLGIVPNGRSEPDYLGWEIKAVGSSRVTLMTPEPDSGMYGEEGVKAFVRKYGAQAGNDTVYFTGTHRANQRNSRTGLTLIARGFNQAKKIIEDVNGAVELLADSGHCAAAWSFSELLVHWNKKHSQAAYIPYTSRRDGDPAYQYFSPALLGEGTDINLYLNAICDGTVIFDPGSKVMNASQIKSTVKARSQFRIGKQNLGVLYKQFGPADF